MYCAHCGIPINETHHFCGSCGKPILKDSSTQIATEAHADRIDPAPMVSDMANVISGVYLADVLRNKSQRRLSLGALIAAGSAILFFIVDSSIYWLVIGLLCWGLWLLYGGLAGRGDNAYKKLLSSTGYENITKLSEDFIKSRQEGTIKIGSYLLSNMFLYQDNFFSFRVYPLSQMTWAYKKVTNHSINFIPTGKSYSLVLHFNPKLTITIDEAEKAVAEHLLLLVNLCPHARFGYTS